MGNRFLGVLLAALVALGALIAAYGSTPGVTRAVGEHDKLVFRDVHGLENAGAFTYRWTNGASTLALPQIGQPQQAALQIKLWVPSTQPPTPLTITANNYPLFTVPIHERRTLTMLLPHAALAGGDIAIGLHSPTWSPPNDPRPLGVGVEQVAWREIGWAFPPIRQFWALPGFVIALALLMLRLRRSTLFACLSASLIGVVLAIGAALWPLAVAPYTHRLLLIVLLAHAALLLWTALMRQEREWWRLPEQIGPGALALLLGIGYWMLLPYQRALCLETVTSVCPRPGTEIVGSIVLLVLLGLALAPRLITRSRWNIALIALALSGVAEAAYAASFAFRRSGPDFFILWRAAYDFHLGRPLYKLADVLGNHFGHVFKVPPFYGMLFLPFATADDVFILLLHRILNVLLYVLTGGLLARFLKPRLGWPLALATVGIILGLMQPPFDTIAYGQIDIVLLLLLTLALFGLRDRRNWLVGLCVALGTLFKLYPLLLVGFLFVRREWKALGWTAAWFAALNGIAIAVMGWQNHVIYVTQVLPNISGGTSWVENQTINGFLSRLITGTMQTDPVRDPLINALTYAGFAVVAGASLLLALPQFDRRSSAYALQFSIFTVVMVLAVPAAWMHYSTITILAFVMLVWFTADRALSLTEAAILALSFGLIAYGNQWTFFDGSRNPGIPALAISYKFFGLALLWSLMIHVIWQAWAVRRRSTVQSPAGRALISTPT